MTKHGEGAAIRVDLVINDDNLSNDDANEDGDVSSSETEDAGLGNYELQ